MPDSSVHAYTVPALIGPCMEGSAYTVPALIGPCMEGSVLSMRGAHTGMPRGERARCKLWPCRERHARFVRACARVQLGGASLLPLGPTIAKRQGPSRQAGGQCPH